MSIWYLTYLPLRTYSAAMHRERSMSRKSPDPMPMSVISRTGRSNSLIRGVRRVPVPPRSCIFPVINKKRTMTRALRRSSGDAPRPSRRSVDRAQLLLRQPFAVACHEALQIADLGDLARELTDI